MESTLEPFSGRKRMIELAVRPPTDQSATGGDPTTAASRGPMTSPTPARRRAASIRWPGRRGQHGAAPHRTPDRLRDELDGRSLQIELRDRAGVVLAPSRSLRRSTSPKAESWWAERFLSAAPSAAPARRRSPSQGSPSVSTPPRSSARCSKPNSSRSPGSPTRRKSSKGSRHSLPDAPVELDVAQLRRRRIRASLGVRRHPERELQRTGQGQRDDHGRRRCRRHQLEVTQLANWRSARSPSRAPRPKKRSRSTAANTRSKRARPPETLREDQR